MFGTPAQASQEQEDWEDIKTVAKDVVPCKAIKDDPTRLNFKKVTVKITHFTVIKGGFFASDFVQY